MIHIAVVLIFYFCYYINDILIEKYDDEFYKLNLINLKIKNYKSNSLSYWI